MGEFAEPRLNDPQWLTHVYETATIQQVASRLGVSNTTVLRALKAHGIERRSRNVRLDPIQHPLLADRDWLASQYTHSTAAGIARTIGIDADTVMRALRLHQIRLHTPAETQGMSRRPELDNADWLRQNYVTRSIASIARQLDVSESAVHTAMIRLGVERRPRGETQAMNRPPILDDRDALAAALQTASVSDIAADLGVAVPTVQVAMKQHGVKSPWKFDGATRLEPPTDEALAGVWESEQTIKGVARRFDVSVNTAAIWLAQVGIFVAETPVISKRDLVAAIERGDSIDVIRRRHHVTGRTVIVELHRHGLHERHRRRHMFRDGPTPRSRFDREGDALF
jgi:transposase-like protein